MRGSTLAVVAFALLSCGGGDDKSKSTAQSVKAPALTASVKSALDLVWGEINREERGEVGITRVTGGSCLKESTGRGGSYAPTADDDWRCRVDETLTHTSGEKEPPGPPAIYDVRVRADRCWSGKREGGAGEPRLVPLHGCVP